MKSVLCFGDSNTWGWDPVASAASPLPCRHAAHVRWTGVLRQNLGDGYTVVEEGQSGRTTVHDDPIDGQRNGRDYLIPCLESHQPIDVVVLMLGTNDLKTRFTLTAADVAAGAARLVQMIQKTATGPAGRAPRILLVAPPAVGDLSALPELAEKFADGTQKSLRFPELYRRVAEQFGCSFLDSQKHTTPTTVDGLHLEASSHASLGNAVADAVRVLE